MGVKISNLPAIVTPALSDIFPVVQGGVTYKESFTQLSSLFATAGANSNITSLSGLTTPLSVAQGGTGIIAFGTGVATALGQNVTGSGGIVLATAPTLTSVNFSTTSGIIGTTTNDNAAAGSVGETIIGSVAFASAVSLTTTIVTNMTSISLTAGDWDVGGLVVFTMSVGASQVRAQVTTISATFGDIGITPNFSPPAGAETVELSLTLPISRVSIAGTTTIYLPVQATFASGTASACGYMLARRRR